jgi:hypothetical protein
MDSEMMEKYGFVYLWYDRKNKRYYVGCHWGYTNDGYISSSPWMLKNYHQRPQDFKRRIIKTNIPSREETYNEELRWLNMIREDEIKPQNETPRYYNLNIRHNKMWHKYDENIKTVGQKISVAKKGKKLGPPSEEHRKAISEARKGFQPTPEHIEKMRQSKLAAGHKHTEEWKRENGERVRQQWASGQRKGKSPSEEHRRKIGDAHRGRKLGQDQIELMKKNNSKSYVIEYYDGSTETICGLKQFGIDKNIPYVSLFKAAQKGRHIPKYNIKTISLAGAP